MGQSPESSRGKSNLRGTKTTQTARAESVQLGEDNLVSEAEHAEDPFVTAHKASSAKSGDSVAEDQQRKPHVVLGDPSRDLKLDKA